MESEGHTPKLLIAFGAIGSVFLTSTGWLYWLSANLPTLDRASTYSSEYDDDGRTVFTLGNDTDSIELSFPTNLDELSSLASHLQQYKKDHLGYVMVLFCSAYLYKQTFAIPGSVFMNLLGGALFGVWRAFPLCCALTALGATCCYLLSYLFGRALVLKYFSHRIAPLQHKVQDNLQSLFFFLVFLRVFPMSPNWFLNLTSPIVGVPLPHFFFSVLIGLMPYNFVCVQTGSVLSQISSLSDMFTYSIMLKLAAVAMVSLLPGIIFKKYSSKAKAKAS